MKTKTLQNLLRELEWMSTAKVGIENKPRIAILVEHIESRLVQTNPIQYQILNAIRNESEEVN